MPTNTEKIDELTKLVAVLDERMNVTRKELQSVVDERKLNDGKFLEHEKKVILIEERVAELKKASEEWSKRRWSLIPIIISAILGAGFMLLIQLFLKAIPPTK